MFLECLLFPKSIRKCNSVSHIKCYPMPAAKTGKTKVIALTFPPKWISSVVRCMPLKKRAIRVRIECNGIKLGVHLFPFLTQYLLRTQFFATPNYAIITTGQVLFVLLCFI